MQKNSNKFFYKSQIARFSKIIKVKLRGNKKNNIKNIEILYTMQKEIVY